MWTYKVAFLDGGLRLCFRWSYVSFFRMVERVDLVCVFFLKPRERGDYASMSSIGMVLAVEVGLKDGMDSMSVFIIHPS